MCVGAADTNSVCHANFTSSAPLQVSASSLTVVFKNEKENADTAEVILTPLTCLNFFLFLLHYLEIALLPFSH